MCSLAWPRGEGRKPHTHRGLLPPCSGPVPEVKPSQPNLSEAGKLHRFGDSFKAWKTHQTCAPERDLRHSWAKTQRSHLSTHELINYELSLVSNCRTFPGWQHLITSGMISRCSKCSQFQCSCYHLQTCLLHWNSLHSVLIRYSHIFLLLTAVSNIPHFEVHKKP